MSSKKDYIAVAAILASEAHPQGVRMTPSAQRVEDARRKIADKLATHYGNENHLFNRERFMAACAIME